MPQECRLGVDQRRQGGRGLHRGVEPEAEFAEERQVGPEAGGDDHAPDPHPFGPPVALAFDQQAITRALEPVDEEGG